MTLRLSSGLVFALALSVSLVPWKEPGPPPEPVPADEQARLITGLRPPKRARPVIAVVAENAGTETTDFVVPYAVLARSGVADVFAVAPEDGSIRLTPALTIAPHLTLEAFSRRYPEGPDYVVVPKLEHAAEPRIVAWLQAQAALGATIVGVCSGAKTLSAAGLLAGRRATGHWYDLDGLRADNPTMEWVPNRRYVADRGVVTTTGVSASLPVSLALVEAMAGRERATALASELGVDAWDARHRSADFGLDLPSWRTALWSRAARWTQESLVLPVAPGIDDLALAFTADAWSRANESRVLAVADSRAPVTTAAGLTLLPDRTDRQLEATMVMPPVTATGRTLETELPAIARHFGRNTAAYVALQLELRWSP